MAVKRDGPNYADALLKLANWREPPKKRRPKALSGGRVTELRPGQRHRGSLLRDIAEISIEHPKLTGRFAARLRHRWPKYEHVSDRTLRRDIAEALKKQVNFLKRIRPELWPELLGITPPTTRSERALREKALEHLRKELLAKTR